MKKNMAKKLAKRKQKISKKLKKRNWTEQAAPMFKASNIQYEIDGRLQGVSNGGIGLIHTLAKKTGLLKEIDNQLEILKRHLPYHESDHVANIAYNILASGTCLQDIELLRNDMDNPSDSLNANWAYMVIASLAWDLKAWYGMLMPYRALGLSIIRMEFKRFIQTFIKIPCLILKSGSAIKYRIIGYNNRLKSILNHAVCIKAFGFT